MQVALNDLGLEHLWIVYPGKHSYTIDARVTALPLDELPRLASALR
jgi:hypothetical protein